MTFELKNLGDEEIIRLQITTFSEPDSSKEFTATGSIVNKPTPEPFKEFLKEQGIGWLALKEFRVETFDGNGGAYGRSVKGKDVAFRPIDW